MELGDMCTLSLDKGKKKVKCHKIYIEEIDRELAIHEDIDTKEHVAITDFKTGFRMIKVRGNIKTIKEEVINEEIKNFIKHFTVAGILEECARIESSLIKEEKA